MKFDQIAWYCNSPTAEAKAKAMFGNGEWIKDTVTGTSTVWGQGPFTNVAELQFNYDLGVELEIIRYISGHHWHRGVSFDDPFLSHVGIHLEDGEGFPAMDGCKLAQETITKSHTNEYLTTGAAAGRKYHYRIFQVSPGSFVKYIKRIHP